MTLRPAFEKRHCYRGHVTEVHDSVHLPPARSEGKYRGTNRATESTLLLSLSPSTPSWPLSPAQILSASILLHSHTSLLHHLPTSIGKSALVNSLTIPLFMPDLHPPPPPLSLSP